ncbi:holo-ACP synthase [Ramlibacter sp. PS4R-6]|uniref:holo-ACP synthase n=1 Tax=Ramlibacter sp. PS4R-6 TaxID=3133438 RepID=UPI0030B78AD6
MTTQTELEAWAPEGAGVRLGFDLARTSGIAESIRLFGRRFTDRLFTARELDYALAGNGVCAERLAARFAAKEAVIKALQLSEAGVAFTDIEVVKRADGACTIALHGEARRIADRMGVQRILVSLSHDGDCAGAVVHALLQQPETTPHE